MRNYIIRRTLQLIPLFLGIALISFLLLSLVGDPFRQLMMDPHVRPEDIARLKHAWGFDKPVVIRFFYWLAAVLKGNFGISIMGAGKPVSYMLKHAIGWTLKFSIASLILAFVVGVPLGIYSALHQYSISDYILTFFAFFGMSMPTFWFAFILMMIFGAKLHWLPIGGVMSAGMETAPFIQRMLDEAKHFILPVIVLSLFEMGSWMRYARSSVLEVTKMDYVRTARAKGLPERAVVYKHILRNALIPIITLLGLTLPAVISGATITETVFSIPGMGRLTYIAIINNDFPVAMACLLLGSVLLILGNFIADLLYAVVDPRIKYS